MTRRITIAHVLEAARPLIGWRYTRARDAGSQARFPAGVLPVRAPAAPPGQTDCCSLVAAVVVGAARLAGVDVSGYDLTAHQLAMCVRGLWPQDGYVRARLCDPAADVHELGLPDRDGPPRLPEPLSVLQRWGQLAPRPLGGHTMLVLDADPATGRVLILEANAPPPGEHLDTGVRWLAGPIFDGSIPADWREWAPRWHVLASSTAWTWRRWAGLV